MWENPIYKLKKEEFKDDGEAIEKNITINVTFSAPRNLDTPGKVLEEVFNKIVHKKIPEKTYVLDIGAAKLRNTLWFLKKGFNVFSVEFPELANRLPAAKKKWAEAKKYSSYKMISPKEFITLKKKIDIILLINEINVMPIPLERLTMLSLCRDKIKKKGTLLWHQWKGKKSNPNSYTEKNKFCDGYLMGGPKHTFYVEYKREETHDLLYSVGFIYDKKNVLSNIQSNNNNYSYIFRPKHEKILSDAFDFKNMIKSKNSEILNPKKINLLELYIKQLKHVIPGRDHAELFKLIFSRIFFHIFKNQLGEPELEYSINENRGKVDFICKNKNIDGIFKTLKEMRNIHCPDVFVECKNLNSDLKSEHYNQLARRLTVKRGMLGFLICRKKNDSTLKHCRDLAKDENKYIIILNDNDLILLSNYKLNEEDENREEEIDEFINEKIRELND